MVEAKPSVSFRDPSGRVVVLPDRVVRIVHPQGKPELEAYTTSATIQAAMERGEAVPVLNLDDKSAEKVRQETADALTQTASIGPVEGTLVGHTKIGFPSHPFEWSAPMLQEAARLTLDLQEGLIQEGLGLKDASAYNILFEGTRPVFIDALSVEHRDPHDPAWTPEAQFTRMFLLPLLLQRDLGLPTTNTLNQHRDGLTPESAHRMTSRLKRLNPTYLWLCTLPTWLARKAESTSGLHRTRSVGDPAQARFILQRSVKRLRRQLDRVGRTRRQGSHWARYMDERSHYTQEAIREKGAFVQEVLEATRPRWVLDVGCNTGHYSLMAAQEGANVVAIDTDETSVGRLYVQARNVQADVLPLVVDIARPTPATGWRNQEHPSFLERATGRFDLVFLLAVVHHLTITERIPLVEVFSLTKRLTRGHILLEHVGPKDPLYQRLLRGRDDHGPDREAFERTLRDHFSIDATRPLTGTHRTLYLVHKDKEKTTEPVLKPALENEPVPTAAGPPSERQA